VLAVRLLTAVVLIPLLVIVLWAGQPFLALLITLIVALAGVEVADLLRRAGLPVEPLVVVGIGLLAVAEAAASPLDLPWPLAAWVVVAVVAGAAVALPATDMRAALTRWAGTTLGGLYIGLLAFLLRIPLTVSTDGAEGRLVELVDPGRAWLLVLVLGVWSYDTLAYAAGRLIGRGSFFAHISPHKTWSGAIGGSLGAIVACAALGGLVGRPLVGAGLGVLLAVAAPLGDLSESLLKRAAGVKDSGHIIPGHGGMLDRVDSFLIAAPAAWLYLALAGLV
jgi:phosphatidate cytidylyltransferase